MIDKLREQFRAGQLLKAAFIEGAGGIQRVFFEERSSLEECVIDRISIDKNAVTYFLKEPPISFCLEKFDMRVAPVEAVNFGDYEPDVRSTLLSLMDAIQDRQGVVFDIGANVGWYSLIVAYRFPSVEVHAFEPIPELRRTIQKNLAGNNIANVHLYAEALSDSRGTARFIVEKECTVASHLSQNAQHPQEGIEVAVTTVDAICSERRLNVKLIKCDIEGAELMMLRGADAVLKGDRPVVMTEMLRKWAARFKYHPNDIISHMRTLGYRCMSISYAGLAHFEFMTEDTAETNFVFLHKENHASIINALL